MCQKAAGSFCLPGMTQHEDRYEHNVFTKGISQSILEPGNYSKKTTRPRDSNLYKLASKIATFIKEKPTSRQTSMLKEAMFIQRITRNLMNS
jgi:hypothetical protein